MRRSFPRFLFVLFLLFLLSGTQAQAFLSAKPWLGWKLIAGCFALMIPWQFGYRTGWLPVGSARLSLLAWLGNVTLGIWGTFVMLSVPFNLGYLVAFFLGYARPGSYSWTGESVLWISLGIGVIGWLQTEWGPRVSRVKIPISTLPEALSGLSIVQISDLHVGPTIGRRYVEKVVRRVMALKPDLIVFTGDFGDGPAPQLKKEWMPLAKLAAPLGKFYVNGNHEYYWGGDPWVEAAQAVGFVALLNENRILQHKGHAITIGGVTDPAAAHFKPAQKSDCASAMRGGEQSALKILLAHQPAVGELAAELGFDLQLSGHTHGGQFFPFLFFMPLAHKHYRGLNRLKSMWLYVCVGTGYWGPPNRFAVPSEISLLQPYRGAMT